jgi:transcription antitermination protein NusB
VTARSKARKRALDVLFEADLRGLDPIAVLADRLAGTGGAGPDDGRPVPAYTVELVEGVTAHRPRIDEIVASYAEGWALDRMPVVDRAVLRIAVYELLWRADVPDAVAIDEAVELAKSLSTDESPRFVNGVLGRIVLVKPPVQVAGPRPATGDPGSE